MTLRGRVALELAVLVALTAAFLVVLPERPVWVDAGLGVLALGLVGATARQTRAQMWASRHDHDRRRHRSRGVLIATVGVALLFAGVGRWTGRAGPLVAPTMPAALLLFTVWATVQQALFQFYLLGRLRALIPALPPSVLSAINGLLFGAVHLADVELTVLTTLGGAVWSWCYLHDQRLAPIVISHAVLGTTYYYWIRGEDLLVRWLSVAGW